MGSMGLVFGTGGLRTQDRIPPDVGGARRGGGGIPRALTYPDLLLAQNPQQDP